MALRSGGARRRSVPSHDREARLGRPLIGLLLSGWALATLAGLMLTDATMFLDLPLGAYLAGQGAFLGLIVVGFSAIRFDR